MGARNHSDVIYLAGLTMGAKEAGSMRARQLGIEIGTGTPGPQDAITDVAGVRVGHMTLIEGDGPLVVGHGPIRTGVTVIVPSDSIGSRGLFAGSHRLNGNGEVTGLEWMRESGLLTTPIGLTNTHSVGVVRDALIASQVAARSVGEPFWSLPVVGETWDGRLNDINGMHVRTEHVQKALKVASVGPVPEGNVGGGTGMICHGFKGGMGSASRVLEPEAGGYTVGVLVQANHGRRQRLSVNGVPVGEHIPHADVPVPGRPPASETSGSIIVVVATDAPLLPHQCARLAQRAGLGIARMGGAGENSSGDMFVAFSTANPVPAGDSVGGQPTVPVTMLENAAIDPLFYAVIEATEEAILNALLAAETMTGRDGVTAYALDGRRLLEILSMYGRGPSGTAG
jgi:D-aminopeptidase